MQTTSALQYSRSFLNLAGRSWCEISPDMSLSQEEVISQPRLLITISHVVGLFTGVNSRAPWNTTPFTIQSRTKGFTLLWDADTDADQRGRPQDMKETESRLYCEVFVVYLNYCISENSLFIMKSSMECSYFCTEYR